MLMVVRIKEPATVSPAKVARHDQMRNNCMNGLFRPPAFLIALALTTFHASAGLADHDVISVTAVPHLETELPLDLLIDPESVTVSGLSSGGFFAHQFHVAYSSRLAGAGIVAGGPYGCVEIIDSPLLPNARLSPLAAAVVACTHVAGERFWGFRPKPPQAATAAALVADAYRTGLIDDPVHLEDDRVWLFHGSLDRVVSPAVGSSLAGLYAGLVTAPDALVVMDDDPARPANHGMPVARPTFDSGVSAPDCAEHLAPYIIDCGFDAAGLMLAHFYPEAISDDPVDPHDSGTLIPFDQTVYVQDVADTGLANVGYLYMPHDCLSGDCRLHVAFHGCQQSAQTADGSGVRDEFLREAGYNRWAGGNHIVVLYPQAAATAANPRGCWDFWGFSGPAWRSKDGVQMRAVAAMIDALLGRDAGGAERVR